MESTTSTVGTLEVLKLVVYVDVSCEECRHYEINEDGKSICKRQKIFLRKNEAEICPFYKKKGYGRSNLTHTI